MPARTLLTADLLARVAERAPVHDRENTFPHEDLADLRAAGYLGAFVPRPL
ncbi:acyl-CoA dehydrogenase, partial [Cellulomonas hominis]|nr:acyl-CoA dehydrogenase [Cellulomonas hominis]